MISCLITRLYWPWSLLALTSARIKLLADSTVTSSSPANFWRKKSLRAGNKETPRHGTAWNHCPASAR